MFRIMVMSTCIPKPGMAACDYYARFSPGVSIHQRAGLPKWYRVWGTGPITKSLGSLANASPGFASPLRPDRAPPEDPLGDRCTEAQATDGPHQWEAMLFSK